MIIAFAASSTELPLATFPGLIALFERIERTELPSWALGPSAIGCFLPDQLNGWRHFRPRTKDYWGQGWSPFCPLALSQARFPKEVANIPPPHPPPNYRIVETLTSIQIRTTLPLTHKKYCVKIIWGKRNKKREVVLVRWRYCFWCWQTFNIYVFPSAFRACTGRILLLYPQSFPLVIWLYTNFSKLLTVPRNMQFIIFLIWTQ